MKMRATIKKANTKISAKIYNDYKLEDIDAIIRILSKIPEITQIRFFIPENILTIEITSLPSLCTEIADFLNKLEIVESVRFKIGDDP